MCLAVINFPLLIQMSILQMSILTLYKICYVILMIYMLGSDLEPSYNLLKSFITAMVTEFDSRYSSPLIYKYNTFFMSLVFSRVITRHYVPLYGLLVNSVPNKTPWVFVWRLYSYYKSLNKHTHMHAYIINHLTC